MLSKKQLTLLYVIIHCLAWTMLFLLPFAIFNVSLTKSLHGLNILILLKSLSIFYLNFFVLVPKLLLQKKVGFYFFSLVGIIVLNSIISANDKMDFHPPPREHENQLREKLSKNNFSKEELDFFMKEMEARRTHKDPYLNNKHNPGKGFKMVGQLSFALMLIGVGTSIKLAEEWFNSEKHKEEVKNEQLTTELAFLKSQINPHFLFNSLNSIYSLAHKKSDLAPEAIIRLSKIMRYIIDDSASSKVMLDKELEHLADYIELQKLRLTNKTKLSYNVNRYAGSETIEPMILVPFIENAFKHGVDSINISVINIKIEVKNNQLTFKSTNTIARQKTETMEAESGIGLKNVQRRLELLYPGKHTLNVLEEEKLYSLTLTLKLKSYELLNS